MPEWKLEKASEEVSFETRPEKKGSTVLKLRRKALRGKGSCFASLIADRRPVLLKHRELEKDGSSGYLFPRDQHNTWPSSYTQGPDGFFSGFMLHNTV